MILGVEETPDLVPLHVYVDGDGGHLVQRCSTDGGWADCVAPSLFEPGMSDLPRYRALGEVRLFFDGVDVTHLFTGEHPPPRALLEAYRHPHGAPP